MTTTEMDANTTPTPPPTPTPKQPENTRPDPHGGWRGAVLEMDGHGGLTARLMFGLFDTALLGHDDRYGEALTAETAPVIAAVRQDHQADVQALPSFAEVQRLQRVTDELRQKISELAAEQVALRESIASAAEQGQLSKADRAKLSSLSADEDASADVLKVMLGKLDVARTALKEDQYRIALAYRDAAGQRCEREFARVRDAILGNDELWSLFWALQVSGTVARETVEHFRRLCPSNSAGW